ncbi:putative internalin [Winogradskyella psychrotolerans RS-3]|uniref:Putative internalin n=1 Tax=Winogradskyella psychrotolerans RS-3 TaxID=641526 RepID=S7VWF5_9FLAO|nr:gliding motility-associated C-terminal domain-containing protein [Winogradskyella psychrotolerans]EPR73697.1 putative internalin [Winogradskyella psychrotolerans RS-3]
MKHLYNPKSKTPRKPLMSLVFIMTLVMVNFYSFGQTIVPLNKKGSKTQQVPSEIFSSANEAFLLHKPSNYTDLQKANIGQANVAFSCDDGFGYILTNVSSSNGNVTGLYSFDLSTNTLTLIKDPIIAETNTSQFINAIGYNIIDNYLYGILSGSSKVVKIDSNGDIELLDITGFTGTNYASGDIDENGILYLYGNNKFVAINLNPSSPDYLVANTVLQHSNSVNDMAFSPVNNKLYMLTSSGSRSLFEFDPVSNTIINLGNVSGLQSESSNSFGTAYMDALGNMYVANNSSGNTYKIATPHLGGTTATFYSNLPGVSPGDGARCPSQPTKPIAIADDICMTSDTTNVTINVANNDSEGTYAIDPNSVQLIDPNTSLPSNSITVSGQGTFTLGSNGDVTFQALASFTGVSIQYTILDVIGFTSTPGVITINLNDTEAPTGSTTQQFCESENATVADLEASGSNIIWYANANSDTPLNSDATLSNGDTYYASQTSSAGCESIERLAVTVNYSAEIALVSQQETSCTVVNGTLYTIEATFTGTAPFTASGDGQPGIFTDNNDGTTTWVSSPIESVVETYNVTINDNCSALTLTGASPADCLNTPFDCDDGFAYIIVNQRNSENNRVSGLYSYDLATHAQTLIKAPLITDTSVSQFVNGIGYNILDNNIYGIQQNTNNIVKIDASANVEFLPITGPFTIGDYSSGDINENGILFLYGENKFVSIDLNPSSAGYLTSTNLLNYSVAINDIVVSPVDGNIYMVTSTSGRKLLRFNIASNTIDDLGSITGLSSETTNAFGTAYMDALGNMYIANNASGNIYRIALPHTGNLIATNHADLIDIEPGDGARCPSQLIIPEADDDSICATSDEIEAVIEINVLENDSAGTYNIDITGVQFIDPVTLLPTTTVTIPGQGTFTVSSDGLVSFEAVSGFSGTSVDYIITDVIGTPSMPATITVNLNTTDAPTGDVNQEFCESSDPTVADLNVTGESIQWYASENETTPIDPSEALIDGNTYYATQTSAEGCESLERLAVTVSLNPDVTLVTAEVTLCSDDNTTYTIIATFIGSAPFTATGNGQPGTWVSNNDDSFTWTSDAIPADQPYNVEITDENSCNTITLSGEAAICCEFIVSCPTFEETTVACYRELPSQTTYTIDEFEELGNADGIIGDDACGIIEITAQNSSDENTCNQTITRTYTITSYEDTNGNGLRDGNETTVLNSTDCTQIITLNDTIAPTFTVPDDITVECDYDSTDLNITGYVSDEADNCSTDLKASFTDSIVDGSCPGSYVISRTWSLIDGCDNTTTKLQTITVQDTTAPTFTGPADITIECGVDITDLSITGDVTDVTDNCAVDLEAAYTDSVEEGTCPGSSVITRTWTLADDCDNATTFVQTITVQDTTVPTFSVPADITIECDVDVTDLSITGDVTDEADNCAINLEAVFTDSISDGSCPSSSIITRTWSLTDDCDNATTFVQTITVQDTTAPSFNETLPADLDVECDAVPTAETLTAADNCGTADVSFLEEITNGSCMGDYIIVRTWTATDDCGNDSVHTQIINVQDNTAPTSVTAFDDTLTVLCDNIPERPSLVFEDSCSNDIDVSFNEESTQINNSEDYDIIRTWTVTDDCGNEALFTQTITVELTNTMQATDANRCILDSEFNLFDLLSGDFDTNGTWSVISGNATVNGSLFDPSSAEVGEYTFMYSIADAACPADIEVNVTLDDDCVVLACGEDDVVISKTVTANGDAYNETFTITGIEDCGFVIELQIFNRWGAEIYKSNNYLNDWRGEAHSSSIGSSGKVPTGTYYYIINLKNSGLEPMAGPIYVATN